MRDIHDLEHFVLGEKETLILRMRAHLTAEELDNVRRVIARNLPGRPVIVLPPEVDVYAGELEVWGAPQQAAQEEPTQEAIVAARDTIRAAYHMGKIIWANEGDGWYALQNQVNPHSHFDWDAVRYSLNKPKE